MAVAAGLSEAAGAVAVAGSVGADAAAEAIPVAADAAVVGVAAAAAAGGDGFGPDNQTNFPCARLGDGLLPAGPLFGHAEA